MSKNDESKKKVGGVGASKATSGVTATHAVGEVSEVEKVTGTTRVSGVGGVTRVGKAGGVGTMSVQQREKFFSMVSQEAEKLAKQGVIPSSQREVVEAAVKMVIDAALADESVKDKS